ncbi:MAG: photolyase PhrII [Mariniblastus sp.]|jgi:photolyase PhrII
MISTLPIHLVERTRVHGGSASEGEFVLYWMRTAVRTDENPALDVAKYLANERGVSLLIYHAISEHYEYASDRHHLFMLQGARDVQQQFAEQELSYAFHLATRDDRRPHLVTLADMALAVVTEDMPVDPPRRFLAALKSKTRTPIFSVDTACVAPMLLVKRAYSRAFQFRSATENIYAERLTRPWPRLAIETKPFDMSILPFEPLDLQAFDLSELISRCDIDHAVAPVVDTIGGGKSGYARWNEFKEQRLGRYAEQRNSALTDGVSRLSAYLHYGMVSPLRIAREVAEIDSSGAEKYLDELLIWRELAYAFCFYRDDHDRWSAIPEWAQQTLAHHASDQRKQIYAWEQLARGQTKNEFWNAAQQSLLRQGELHNNVRMTWGKAILNWTKTPQQGLETIIDLNHRYALDGRDPASYGGILWCLGQFDRPFEPEQGIIGSVRPRPTSQHASRLNLQSYQAKVAEPRFFPIPHVAIIGAGVSGLFAARTLQDHGLKVTVFEKGRGVGGRMSTRRIGSTAFKSRDAKTSQIEAVEQIAFDHGAQYFTVRNQVFERYVDSWIQQGIVAKWPDRELGDDQNIVVLEKGSIKSESNRSDRFVGVPSMNAICKHLAGDVQVLTRTCVGKVQPVGNVVELIDDGENSLGKFDRLIVSAPAAQSAELLVNYPSLANRIADIEMNPCWAVMVALENPITELWNGAFMHDSFLSWAARNSTKPSRESRVEQLVIHARPEWSEKHWEHDPNEVAETMLAEFWKVSGLTPQPNLYLQAHRWKYAIPVETLEDRCLVDDSGIVFACGDWANGSRVEGAFLSGMATAGRILGGLDPVRNDKPRQTMLFN